MYRSAIARRVARRTRRSRSVTTSVLTAGCAAILLAPPTAHADYVNWEAVAECESGGDWGADTGNGFYGGLQFKESTWREFGGRGSPAKASKAEQIAVANRVLAKQGPGAWPTCGKNLGTPVFSTTPWQRPLRDLIETLWSAIPH